MKKTRGRKSRVRVPLKRSVYILTGTRGPSQGHWSVRAGGSGLVPEPTSKDEEDAAKS
jgi:hypothetical protein